MCNKQYFTYGETETAYLKKCDPVLGAAIDAIGHIDRAVTPELFAALMNAIVGQQISTKAQATIWARMQERFAPMTAETINAAPESDLQACGISHRKAAYMKGIAAVVANGGLDLAQLRELPDEEVCKRLSQLKGIGVWTAEMLLIFSMQRPNVLSYGDLAIIRGMKLLYHHRAITPKLFAKYKRRYAPYATTASLYLWAIAGGAYAGLGGKAGDARADA